METEQKKWYQSITVWFNVLTFAVLFADAIKELNLVPMHVLTVITIAGNLLLRVFFTSQPIQK